MPLPWFFLLTFLFSWGFWLLPLLASRGMLQLSAGTQLLCVIAGSFGPFVACFVSLHRDGGWPAMRDFALRCLRFRIGLRYLVAAMLLSPVLGLIAAWVYARLGGAPLAMAVPVAQIPMVFAMLFFVGGSVNEEFGWAYAIDRLQKDRRLLPAAVALGLIWGFWHLPLFFIVGITQSFLPFWAFLIFTVALRLLFVWTYEGTGKSLLVTLLFHTTTNLTLNLFVLVDRSAQRDERGFIAFALLALGVAATVALRGQRYRRVYALPAAAKDSA
jgi:hypothetical protein